MQSGVVSQKNVERIVARIVANELEFRGFRVTDLNKDGLSPDVDLLAARDGRSLQVQVKGASQVRRSKGWENWWVQYGYCDADTIAQKQPIFNRIASFYKADIVALVAVRTPNEYCCVLLPVEKAEEAVQLNLDRDYRTLTLKGSPRRPHKIWVYLDKTPKFRDQTRKPLFDQELKILNAYMNKWNV